MSLAITIALISAFVIMPAHLAAAQSSAITSAQNTLTTCYEAAKQAEAAGANITSLQDTLNVAGEQLTKAQYAQSQGNTASANTYAQQVQNTLNGFVQQANTLRETAAQQTQTSFLINVVASIAGTFIVIVGSIAIWFIFKRKNPSQGDTEN
jgi:FlaG/FlaF family flagellin (archaellin)